LNTCPECAYEFEDNDITAYEIHIFMHVFESKMDELIAVALEIKENMLQ
jgi:hypothetical protein